MIHNIIFDIGNVLADFRWKDLFKDLGFIGEKFDRMAEITVMHPTMWNEFDRSLLSDEELIAKCIENAPECEKEIRLLFNNMEFLVKEYTYSYDWIKRLKAQGYNVYLLSNYARTSFEAAKKHGGLSFLSLVDGGVISYEVQIVKPEPEIYKLLLEKYNLKAEECVFLDDRTDNIEAAEAFGIHGIVVKSYEQAVESLEKVLNEA